MNPRPSPFPPIRDFGDVCGPPGPRQKRLRLAPCLASRPARRLDGIPKKLVWRIRLESLSRAGARRHSLEIGAVGVLGCTWTDHTADGRGEGE